MCARTDLVTGFPAQLEQSRQRAVTASALRSEPARDGRAAIGRKTGRTLSRLKC